LFIARSRDAVLSSTDGEASSAFEKRRAFC
jgi:hypothetical protein